MSMYVTVCVCTSLCRSASVSVSLYHRVCGAVNPMDLNRLSPSNFEFIYKKMDYIWKVFLCVVCLVGLHHSVKCIVLGVVMSGWPSSNFIDGRRPIVALCYPSSNCGARYVNFNKQLQNQHPRSCHWIAAILCCIGVYRLCEVVKSKV